MKNKKKLILNILFFSCLILITYYVIFKDYSMKDILVQIKESNHNYLLLAFILMWFYFLFEAINIKLILSSFKEKLSLCKSIVFTLICFLFSAITPGGSGGQPVAIYYLSKEKIKVSHSALSYLIMLFGYNICSILLGVLFSIIYKDIFDAKLRLLFIVGTLFVMVPIALTFIGIFCKSLTNKLVNLVIKILTKFKSKKVDEFKDKIHEELKVFNDSSTYIKNHKKEFAKSFGLSLLQVICNYTIPYLIYRSFGLDLYTLVFVFALQAILHNCVASIPLPGAVGITETAFLMIYSIIYPVKLIHSSLIVTRFITFYAFLIISLITFIIYQVVHKKQNN